MFSLFVCLFVLFFLNWRLQVPFVQIMSVYVSSLTMAAIAVDRYRVILSPLKPRLRPPHGLAIMLIMWILSAVAALPYAIYSEVVPIFTYR